MKGNERISSSGNGRQKNGSKKPKRKKRQSPWHYSMESIAADPARPLTVTTHRPQQRDQGWTCATRMHDGHT